MKLSALMIIAFFVTMALLTFSSSAKAFADPLQNAYRQRIGNYDVEMTTEPASPVAGSPANVLIRIAGVNGDDLVDVSITIRLAKDGAELQRTNPIIVPYGHYTYEYTFAEAGRYVLYVDLNDHSYSGEILTFTFFVNVAGPFDYVYYIVAPSTGVAVAAIAGTVIFMKRKRKASSRIKP
ncbi:hypothetical protein Ngar_c02810 [Candidatus Nitrososphaera gargensis Ga9.2]|uniref:YtkA-like domain-containing protein n=1 Tax=Nitrososphaera gargensis (strain Ga9.2) TaxID=1237085 RepID=K0ILQ4_NITGG|nr:hypothetical protein [Candidatus Nitrososphaera gargensis]AFU57229.1 hypothetical protein Ngar_c02810 [Candidatus Nitrososphaera gargensis Ga9.2]